MRKLVAVVLATVIFLMSAAGALASTPPPPPAPPNCPTCGGPPPPPTPVPTVAPTAVAPQSVVDVHLTTTRIPRGHEIRLQVDASTDDVVTVSIRFKSGKPILYQGKIGSSGTLVKTWKVPKSAPLGKASVAITVAGKTDKYAKSLDFQVVR